MDATTRRSKVDLLQELRRRYEYGLIATFNLDVQFLEDYLLNKVGSFSDCSYLTILMDADEYEILSSSLDQQVKHLNRRYLLVPILVSGAFHAKVYIFVTKKKGLLILGSANLTRAGLTRNAELVLVHRYDQDEDEKNPSPLFQQAFSFFIDLQRRGLSHSKTLEEHIERMANEIPWLQNETEPSIDSQPFRFIHNLEKPIIEQMVTEAAFHPNEAHFLSPYFDQSPNLIEHLSNITRAQSLFFYTQNGTTTLNPEWIASPQARVANAKFYLVEYEDGGRPQNLHGKAVVLNDKKQFALYFGSANCTTHGLLSSSENGNVETGLLIFGKTSQLGDLKKLFVAGNNRRVTLLSSATNLQTSRSTSMQPIKDNYPIRIWEVELDGDKLNITVSITFDTGVKDLILVIERNEIEFSCLPLKIREGKVLKIKCPDKVLNWLNNQTCVIYLGYRVNNKVKPLSNRVFMVNLRDPETGKNLREARFFKDARLGHKSFLGILTRLSEKGDDVDQLVKFLTLCEIPYNERFHPFKLSSGRVLTPYYGEELRILGRRNIKLFQNVHQAAMHFIERHQKRLEKHVAHGSPRGISNFMHMFLSMGYVIQSQLEKLVIGLESLDRDLDPNDWYKLRKETDEYYRKYDDIMKIYSEKYVPKFKFLDKKKIKEYFYDTYDDVKKLYNALEILSSRLEKARKTKFKVLTLAGKRVEPPTTEYECFAPHRLQTYLATQRKRLEMIEEVISQNSVKIEQIKT